MNQPMGKASETGQRSLSPDLIRPWLLQSLWFSQASSPSPAQVRPALEIARLLAAEGLKLPPLGFLSDFIQLALGSYRPSRFTATSLNAPPELLRDYSDSVLGKLALDWSFERASTAIRKYSLAERPRSLAYAVKQLMLQCRYEGIDIPPTLLRNLLALPPQDLLQEGIQSLAEAGPYPELLQEYQLLITSFRRSADLFPPEDLLALEQRTALAELGQYVAHRLIAQTLIWFDKELPDRPLKPLPGRREVPTQILDEDQYPVGGYASIATKGSIESMLHSQLAYMDDNHRPDMFDIKFLRDELFYYSRDENQFLRKSRAFVVSLDSSLIKARFKDPELPQQRIVLLQALILVILRRLTDWLNHDALIFEIILEGKTHLDAEAELFTVFLQEAIARKSASIHTGLDDIAIRGRIASLVERNQTHVLSVGMAPKELDFDRAVVTQLVLGEAAPQLIDGHGDTLQITAETAAEAWLEAGRLLLALWA